MSQPFTRDEASRLVHKFNAMFPVGSRCYWRSLIDTIGYEILTVEHPAVIADSGVPVGFFKEKSGYVAISERFVNYNVKPIDEPVADIVTEPEAPAPEPESSSVQMAREELVRAGLFDAESDYGGGIGGAALELIQVFARQGHSGGSANATLEVFDILARHKPLTPVTSDPSEWFDRSEESGTPMWQNKRVPSVFSTDGGQTWYDLDAPKQEDPAPIDMILYCPVCHTQHIDEPRPDTCGCGHPTGEHNFVFIEGEAVELSPECSIPGCPCRGFKGWDNPPHRSHFCGNCITIWRPADVSTNGVAQIKTRGTIDTFPESTTQSEAGA